MNRRTTLKTVGASILAGATLTSTGAAAVSGGPRVVDIASETGTENAGDGAEYAVVYGDDGTVELTGETTVPTPCHEAAVVGIESTQFGDVVRVAPKRTDDMCPDVLSRLSFRIELEYEDEADDVFLEFVDADGR